MIKTHIFDRICASFPGCPRECSGILPTLSRSAAFSWVHNSTGNNKCPRTYTNFAL